MQPNPKQKQAIEKIDWPLLIIAGAGSGKTATLTARVENMIRNKGIDPSSILMVTFTNKAALEMRERVAKVLWVETPKNLFSARKFPLIWTFHSIWIYFLKQALNPKATFFTSLPEEEKLNNNYYSEISERLGLKKDFIIYDEQDKLSILKSIIKNDLNLEEKEYPARQIAFYISNAKNALISAKAYEREIDWPIKEVVFQVYSIYEKKLRENNAMDFDDILVKTLSLLQIPQILEYYQEKYKYLMIDEYQDTNAPQYEIIKLLAWKYRNLAVVWDDAQSIYSWRWANMQNILNFKKDYPEAEIIKLEQNYRSTQNILAWANAVIANNRSQMKKELWSDKNSWNKIVYIEAPDDKIEAKTIVEIIKEKRWSYKDNLILYRTNAQSRIFEEALMIANIPYRVIWGLKFYDRKEIKDLLAYLKIIHNKDDIVSLKRIINVPTRKIWAKSIEVLDNYRENFWLSYFDIIENIDEVEELRPAAKTALKWFLEIYKDLVEKSNNLSVWELIEYIVNKIKYKEYIKEWLSREEADSKIENIEELINIASEYNWMEPREWLSLFLEEVALLTDMDKKDERSDYVTLMTIHTSKWLEEKRVFLVWLEEWIFPSFRSIWENAALEEERRLMYVAMTRAKEELYISRAKERFHFWDYVRNPESRFVWEIPEELIESYDFWDSSLNSSSFFENSFNPLKYETSTLSSWAKLVRKVKNNDVSQFNRWDRVSHPKFWNGIITSLNWELAEIAFSWKWVKKMNIKIAPVKKI